MKIKIINATLNMIKVEKSTHNVSLREIARRVGCSAPNVYNHFQNLNDLLNAAMQYIIDDYMKTINRMMNKINKPELIFKKAAETLISYALKNEGWFYFYHFEKNDLRVSDLTEEKENDTGHYMATLVQKSSNGRLDFNDAYKVTGIIHHYILGELSQYLSGKEKIKNKSDFLQKIITNAFFLFTICINSNGKGD
jgi:AcrR family transcriptional regulator